MSSRFRFVVEVELERTEGKFAGRDEMADAIQNALDDANPSQVDGIGNDGTSTYEVVGWDVAEEEVPKPAKRGRRLIDPADYPIMQRVHPQTGEPIGPPIDTRRLSHAGHDHPATAAARAACRAQRAAYLRDHPEEN
jgi:hypothetical protein